VETDWSVACGSDDPLVVVPWRSADGLLRYIDLRLTPDGIAQIPEAVQHDCIAAALERWNQPDSVIFTAKCDVWAYPADLFDAEDLEDFAFAQGNYIDLLARDPDIFSDFKACEQQLRKWSETARSIELPQCRCEWTLRRAHILQSVMDRSFDSQDTASGEGYQDGFATTLYVWGYGSTSEEASKSWASALRTLIDPVCLFKRF